MLRPTLVPRIGTACRTFRRSLHNVPQLSHDFAQEGVPGFLGPAGFDVAWTQYQKLMVERLNRLTVGGEYEHKTPKEIALKYARDPNSAPIFNYASMAHNNHFFFSGLSPVETAMPEPLQKELEDTFQSIETLRKEMIVTASSMFGPGFVWLVKLPATRKFSLLTTYLAGSPYPGAHYRRQAVDMNTEDPSVSESLRRTLSAEPVNTVGAHGAYSEKKLPPGGIDLIPTLCINTWEHVYLPDYGVGAVEGGGVRAYAERWWDRIDWNVVANHANVRGAAKFQR